MHSPKILLVDDDPVFAHIVSETAKVAGISLEHTPSTNELSEEMLMRFDVLICDFEIPTITGVQVSKALSVRAPELPMILISNYKSPLGNYQLPKNHIFLQKTMGPQFILSEAITLHHQSPQIQSKPITR